MMYSGETNTYLYVYASTQTPNKGKCIVIVRSHNCALTFQLVCKPAQGCKVGVVWGGRVSVHVLEEREAQSHASL